MSKHIFARVIKSDHKKMGIFKNQYYSFAERIGLKNKKYLTPVHYKVKWFTKKHLAEEYLLAKNLAIGPINDVKICRKKMFLDKKGKYDYWKNRKSLLS